MTEKKKRIEVTIPSEPITVQVEGKPIKLESKQINTNELGNTVVNVPGHGARVFLPDGGGFRATWLGPNGLPVRALFGPSVAGAAKKG